MSEAEVIPTSILLVDDDQDIRESLADALAYEGYRVEMAANGKEALDKLQSMPAPGLVLLDLTMPVMSGWRFLELFSALQPPSTVPILVVSASVPPTPEGAAGWLRKPVELDALLAKVAECARSSRAMT